MTTCEWCGEPKFLGFHVASLLLGLAVGVPVFIVLSLLQ